MGREGESGGEGRGAGRVGLGRETGRGDGLQELELYGVRKLSRQ